MRPLPFTTIFLASELHKAATLQKLIGQRRQTRNVLKHAPRVRAEGQRFQSRLKNRDRRAEFVRRIDKKPLVSLVALIKAA